MDTAKLKNILNTFSSFVTGFIDHLRGENPYARRNQYHYRKNRFFSQYKGTQKRKSSEPNNYSLSELLPLISRFKKICVVGSGPSAKGISIDKNDTLYICTNGSVMVAWEAHFLYFVVDNYYLDLYISNGFTVPGWIGTLFRFSKVGSSTLGQRTEKQVRNYINRYKRSVPEVFISDYVEEGQAWTNFCELDSFIEKSLDVKLKQFNSGFVTVFIGFYLAHHLNIPLEIYGIDMGKGGYVYFSGENVPAGDTNSTYRDRPKEYFKEVLHSMYKNKSVEVLNYSFFEGNVKVS